MGALTTLNRAEVLRYLGQGRSCPQGGSRPQDASHPQEEALNALIDRCMAELCAAATPRTIHRFFELGEDGVTLAQTDFTLMGEDIRKHLIGCKSCVLMAATLGTGVEALLRTAQVTDMTRALVLDSCATVAIEQVCDAEQAEISARAAKQSCFTTTRFSPGYGDMPIEQQKMFLTLLDTPRKIGLCATESNLLTPQKSVTAVLGISENAIAKKRTGCGICSLCENCTFRKAGVPCGSKGFH